MTSSLYLFITYPRKQRDNDSDIYFVVPENTEYKPQCIYIDTILIGAILIIDLKIFLPFFLFKMYIQMKVF